MSTRSYRKLLLNGIYAFSWTYLEVSSTTLKISNVHIALWKQIGWLMQCPNIVTKSHDQKFIPAIKNYLNIKRLSSVRPNGDAKFQKENEKKIKEPP